MIDAKSKNVININLHFLAKSFTTLMNNLAKTVGSLNLAEKHNKLPFFTPPQKKNFFFCLKRRMLKVPPLSYLDLHLLVTKCNCQTYDVNIGSKLTLT